MHIADGRLIVTFVWSPFVSMKFTVRLFLLVLFSMPAANGLAAKPLRLRVLSYNIHHAEGVDRELDVDRIAKMILAVKPDIVALQEVDQKVRRTNSVDQPAELARLTQMNVAFGPNIDLQGGHYGNAILTRFTVKEHKNYLLPNLNDGEQRGVLAAKIKTSAEPTDILVLATHFDHRPDDKERMLSAKFINHQFQNERGPALLMGDLNDVVGSRALNQLESIWKRTNTDPLPTVPVDQPKRQIDFILFRPADRWTVVETRVLEEAVASDHRAILSVLELQPE